MLLFLPLRIYPRLSQLARFNKVINTKTFFRTLKSGKQVMVSAYSRRGKYMRAMAALDSIKSHPIEHGFLANQKTGKVSQKVTGEADQVDILGGVKAGESWRVLQRRNIAAELHNHPGRHTGTLSPGDYAGGFQIAAIDKSGNVTRGKSNLPAYSDRLAAQGFHQSIADSIHAKQVKQWNESGTKKRFPARVNHLLRYHHANKVMAEKGINRYRSKLTPLAKKADSLAGSSYTKAARQAYGEEYIKLPINSRIRKRLPTPRLSPKLKDTSIKPLSVRKSELRKRVDPRASLRGEVLRDERRKLTRQERQPLLTVLDQRRAIAQAKKPKSVVQKLRNVFGRKQVQPNLAPPSDRIIKAAARKIIRKQALLAPGRSNKAILLLKR